MHLTLNKEHFTFHIQYKHSGMFANRNYDEPSYPKHQKMCNPILVTLLKMQPRDSQSCHENVTPSSGTCPLTSYKEVPPPPPLGVVQKLTFYSFSFFFFHSILTPKYNAKILFAGFFRANVQTWKAGYRKDKMIHGLEIHCKLPDAHVQRAASSLDAFLQQNIMWCVQHKLTELLCKKYFYVLSRCWCEFFSLTVCFHYNPSSLSKRTLLLICLAFFC